MHGSRAVLASCARFIWFKGGLEWSMDERRRLDMAEPKGRREGRAIVRGAIAHSVFHSSLVAIGLIHGSAWWCGWTWGGPAGEAPTMDGWRRAAEGRSCVMPEIIKKRISNSEISRFSNDRF
ncbi:hypothetical protein F511_42028 [Dorcoceras hygrometricum]|uniref:Uncharacterized protein n=1 Tax=Dorcoceras hygrometricum TaxID=472368 RepID=A0A2Z7AWP8_9LAMI|nr:hypothetical protein F511_42028 [Dorcoceras hygrometricum]